MINQLLRRSIRPRHLRPKNLQRLLRLLSLTPPLPHLPHQFLQARETVQRPTLRRRRKQRLMIVRTVQVHQTIPQLF